MVAEGEPRSAAEAKIGATCFHIASDGRSTGLSKGLGLASRPSAGDHQHAWLQTIQCPGGHVCGPQQMRACSQGAESPPGKEPPEMRFVPEKGKLGYRCWHSEGPRGGCREGLNVFRDACFGKQWDFDLALMALAAGHRSLAFALVAPHAGAVVGLPQSRLPSLSLEGVAIAAGLIFRA